MKQRYVLLIVSLIIVILVIALFAFYWNTSQFPKETVEAKITDFSADLGWYPIAGVTMIVFFNVTIQNVGNQNISGVQVTVQRLNADNISLVSGNYTMANVGEVNSGETHLVKLDYLFGLDRYNEYAHSNYIAVLSINGSTVLDEKRLY